MNSPERLVKYVRDGLVEQEHFGYILLANRNRVLEYTGESCNQPFYLRSCAKPLQASLLIDFGMDKFFDMSEEEIAICCASHSGEKIHTDLISGLLKKIGLDSTYLKCGIHPPLSKTEQKRMFLDNEGPNVFHNNCSGKHTMMLGLCVMNGWDLMTYDDVNHPLQKMIKQKIYELCEVKSDYPVTTDGCGVPIFSVPLPNMVRGFLNVFCNPVYEKITNAFLNNPYVIGGEDRTDTKIIENTKNIIAKVGAGGLCVVVNTEKEEGFVVKICDCDMKAREIMVADILKNLHWGEIPVDKTIKTLHGQIVGEIVCY